MAIRFFIAPISDQTELAEEGTDALSGTLEGALFLILNHPRVLAKAQSKIYKVVGFDRLMDKQDMGKLPYLHCIISERLSAAWSSADTTRVVPGVSRGRIQNPRMRGSAN
ncbi:hypothetical protein MLD38_001737 [Melastoma candidum]|uniref:Uncharacterized protein n=1 Tax=Melastoma candidum TaxID=119954 RepID=A0ACB9SDM7_9MYRT|nr:hypothetical protein MLD38_001737 [Melastoma candidum]